MAEKEKAKKVAANESKGSAGAKAAMEGKAANESKSAAVHGAAGKATVGNAAVAGAKDASAQNGKKGKSPKKEKKSRKAIVKRSASVIALRSKAQSRARLPVFRGRFGSRSIRKKANAKWDKWRFPRGLDVNHELHEGLNPKAGHGTDSAIHGVHPSGYREAFVAKESELGAVKEGYAVRFASGIGAKKKMMLVDKAIEKGLRVLNP